MSVTEGSNIPNSSGDTQDNFVEVREPAELMMCILLGAAYAGLAKYCWSPLLRTATQQGHWSIFLNVEGFFTTITLLSILVGLRPYLSPCSLQLSNVGIKYRGPYWPKRKSVSWNQVSKLYLSPELILVLYHPQSDSKRIWPLFIQSVYLAHGHQVSDAIKKYSPVPPIILASPNWISRMTLLLAFLVIVIWILEMLIG